MKNIRWQLIIILVTGLVIGILLLSEQTGFNIARPVSNRGGTYTEGLIGNLQRLNPVLDYYNAADRDVDHLIFSKLIRFDENGRPQSELAVEWGISFDGLSYNFDLNPDAVWHDGTPVTSADVLYTVNTMRSDESVLPEDLKTFWKKIEVIPLGDKSVQFRLNEPFAPFMDYLNFGILPNHLLGELSYQQLVSSSFNLEPIGSGPYRFDRLITESGAIRGVVLEANDDYYGEIPLISQFVFLYFDDAASAYSAYSEGLIQGLSEVPQVILEDVLADPAVAVYSAVKPEVSLVLFNLNNSRVRFLQEENIRKALLHALDRRRLIDSALMGQGIVADIPILPSNWAYYSGVQRYEFDLQQAEQYLADEGYQLTTGPDPVLTKDGDSISFELVHPDDEIHTAVAEAVQEDWARIGVQVELVAVSYDVLILDYLEPLTYQAALIDLNFERSPDPDPYPFWDQSQQSGGQNFSQWENKTVSEYLEEARVTTDMSLREKLYRNFQVIFQEELPALPLFYPVYNFALDNGINGVRVGSFYDTPDRFFSISAWFLLAQTTATN